MSAWISVPLILLLAGVIVGRVTFVSRRQFDRHVTWLLVWWLAAALLREPWVQSAIVSKSVTLSDVRLATHAFVIAGAVAIFVVVRAWTQIRPVPTRTIMILYASVAVATVVQAWVSTPARSAGLAVEELHDWRTAVYMVIYSAPMPLALTPLILWCTRVVRRPDSARSLRVWGLIVIVCACISWMDHMSRLVNGVMLSLDWHNAFTQARSESNDVLFLPFAAALAIVVAAPVVTAMRMRSKNDPASHALVRLTPMWQDLVLELPSVELKASGWLPNPAEHHHRIRIEVEDALFLLSPYLPDTDEKSSPLERCEAIVLALERRRRDPSKRVTEPGPTWMADEDEILRIADMWTSRTAASASTH